jgi:YD repeat-containing protein
MTNLWTKAAGWAMSALAVGVLAAPALAQGLGIPPRQDARSPHGVSYGSGAFTLNVRDLSIGGDFPQGLTLDRTYMSSVGYASLGGLGWTHNWSGRISLQAVPLSTDMESPLSDPKRWPQIYNVTVGGSSAGFIGGSHFPPATGYPQGTYEPISPTGASLVYTGSTPTDGYYIFTDSDGSLINFAAGGQPQHIVDWTTPDGTRLAFTYDGSGYTRSVISTRGYALLFEPPNGSGQRKACAVNMAQHYVTATSTCPAGAQSVTYSYAPPPGDPTLVQLTGAIDAAGQTTTYGYQRVGGSTGLHRLTCITAPGQSGCQLQNSYSVCHEWDSVALQWRWGDAYVTSQQTATGEAYTYAYTFPDAGPPPCDGQPSTHTVTTANATAVTHVYPTGGVPGTIVDPLGRSTSFSYMVGDSWAAEPGALIGVTSPLGNSTGAVNDARGNITQQTQTATPGSGLAARTTTAVFPASCISTNRRICNKPTSVTNANGSTTDYTYDAAHGGVLTETGPSVGGVRPQTRHEYAQRYAWIKTSGGSYVQAATPVWVRTATSSCRTSAATGSPCATTGDEVRTAYDYGPNSGPNTLLLRGQTVTATDDSVTTTLRTCYGYDAQGNKISETTPNANLASCP